MMRLLLLLAALLLGCGCPCRSPLAEWRGCTSNGGCRTLDEVAQEECADGLIDFFVGSCGEFTILEEADSVLFGSEAGYDSQGNLAFARVCGDTAGFCAGQEPCHVYGEMPDCEVVTTNRRLCDPDR